jgi:hypothetical protein
VQRSGGVTASAVIVFIGSALTLVTGAFTSLGLMLIRDQPAQVPFMRLILVAVVVCYFAFGIWGISSGIGLLRLREWARISILVFSVLLLVCTLPGLAIFPFMPMGQQGPEVPAAVTLAIKIALEIFYGIVAGIGIWWLWFFNRRKVKEQFRGAGANVASPDNPLARPLSISIIGWFMLVTGCIVVPFLFLRFPTLFLGMVLSGWRATVAILALGAVQIVAGVGLLRLRPWARTLSICYFVFGLFNGAATFLLPGAAVRLNQIIEFTQARMNLPTPPQPSMMHVSMLVGAIVGLALALIQLWFVVTRKEAFSAAREGTAQPL